MEAAEAAGISERTARKWLTRWRAEGPAGLADRSSAPNTIANRTDERRIGAIAALRRVRMTGAEIAECLEMPVSTVSGILTRIGMGRLGRPGPAVAPVRPTGRTSCSRRTARTTRGHDRSRSHPYRTFRSGGVPLPAITVRA